MKKVEVAITLLFIALGMHVFGQSEDEIVTEATKMYKTEMASWYGTDIFLERFKDKRPRAGGYFSYSRNGEPTCVFFSNDSIPQILATIAFDSSYSIHTAKVDGKERMLTVEEHDLLAIRQAALHAIQTDTLFKLYKDMSLNLIPLNDEQGKRVYILTGPQKHGVVVLGNDYLLTFNQNNKLLTKKRLHKNIIVINYAEQREGTVATMHTHLPETGDLITATDICTLKLYAKFAKWPQHYVISQKNVSIWDCKKEDLVVLTKDAWDQINDDQKKRNKK